MGANIVMPILGMKKLRHEKDKLFVQGSKRECEGARIRIQAVQLRHEIWMQCKKFKKGLFLWAWGLGGRVVHILVYSSSLAISLLLSIT